MARKFGALSVFALLLCAVTSATPQRSAGDIFAAAKASAAAQRKHIFLVFGASWCTPCHELDAFLADRQMRLLIDKHFIVAEVNVEEERGKHPELNTPGGEKLLADLDGKDSGIPFIVFADEQGQLIINSNRPVGNGAQTENVGYPVLPEEIDWFMSMLHKTLPAQARRTLRRLKIGCEPSPRARRGKLAIMASPIASFSSVHSTNPATGEVVAGFDATPARELSSIFLKAREAQVEWAATPLSTRCRLLRRLADVLRARRDQVAGLVTQETGKPQAEALFADVLISLETAKYYARETPYILAGEPVAHQNVAARAKSSLIGYQPLGVIAVISPWNFPLAIPLGHVIPAVAAGNAVVLKPSERAPACGQLIADCFREAGFPPQLVQVVHGGPELGAALVDAHPDKVVFTGSTAVGKQIAVQCAMQLIPSVLELGGKDAMIVLADADIEAASSAAVWGAFTNCGQACLSTERIFVEQSVAERFTQRVLAQTQMLRLGPGADPDNEIGPMILPQAVERIEAQLQSAVAAGARVLTGGRRRPDLGSCYFEPTVVTGVNRNMPLMQEPIFGPVVAIQPVANADEAIALTNDCAYGLSASVWTADRDRGRRLAGKIRGPGAIMVNDLASYFGILEAPHGGSGLSGWGRTHSRIGLLEMVQVRYTDVDWLPRRPKTWWFGYDQALVQAVERFIDFSHAPQWRARWRGAAGMIKALIRRHRI